MSDLGVVNNYHLDQLSEYSHTPNISITSFMNVVVFIWLVWKTLMSAAKEKKRKENKKGEKKKSKQRKTRLETGWWRKEQFVHGEWKISDA